MNPEIAVCCADLHKRFGASVALRGVDLEIPRGTVHGLLGPNGAGKTTLVRILATLTRPDRGRARVAGHDVVSEADQVRYRIGLAGQHASVDERLSGRANLRMFGRLYHLPDRVARRRADELLERYDLADAADRSVRTYSGGMLRRLHLLASLLVAPPVLFLDEPTTGLDPRSRGDIWDAVRDLAAAGTTVLLTTQYLDEADRLADHITVIDTGRVIASGGPDELKAAVGSRIDVVVHDIAALAGAASVLAAIGGGEPEIDADERRISVPAWQGAGTLTDLVRELDRSGVVAEDIALRRPTLDEVFLTLTGRPTEAEVTV